MTLHHRISPLREDDIKILEVLEALGDMNNRERITLLYMAIDYIYMQDRTLVRKHEKVITEH
jgi:hypothetical protein